MNLVKSTIYLSILIQVVALVIGVFAYNRKVPMKDMMLKDILLIENVVQAVEFIFYLAIGFIITNIPTKHLAKYRYYDWAITTPIMLLTTLLFFIYEDNKYNRNENDKEILSAWDVIMREKRSIILFCLSNLGMLLMGFLQETNKLSIMITNTIGFLFLFYSFYILNKYAKTETSRKLFWVMLVVWSLYGVVATFDPVMKNTSYNILDVISKNFYGIFLAVLIYRLKTDDKK